MLEDDQIIRGRLTLLNLHDLFFLSFRPSQFSVEGCDFGLFLNNFILFCIFAVGCWVKSNPKGTWAGSAALFFSALKDWRLNLVRYISRHEGDFNHLWDNFISVLVFGWEWKRREDVLNGSLEKVKSFSQGFVHILVWITLVRAFGDDLHFFFILLIFLHLLLFFPEFFLKDVHLNLFDLLYFFLLFSLLLRLPPLPTFHQLFLPLLVLLSLLVDCLSKL